MDKKYLKAVEKTLKHEGGYNKVKGDAGGATNHGISLRFLEDLHEICDWVDIDRDGDIDADDVCKLTKEDAIKIYYENFWLKNKCDKILDDNIAAKLFDMSVNMGLSQAAKILQRSINTFRLFSITVDGKIGEKTLQGANQIFPEHLLHVMRNECADFYQALVDAKPQYAKFLKGWLNRAAS